MTGRDHTLPSVGLARDSPSVDALCSSTSRSAPEPSADSMNRSFGCALDIHESTSPARSRVVGRPQVSDRRLEQVPDPAADAVDRDVTVGAEIEHDESSPSTTVDGRPSVSTTVDIASITRLRTGPAGQSSDSAAPPAGPGLVPRTVSGLIGGTTQSIGGHRYHSFGLTFELRSSVLTSRSPMRMRPSTWSSTKVTWPRDPQTPVGHGARPPRSHASNPAPEPPWQSCASAPALVVAEPDDPAVAALADARPELLPRSCHELSSLAPLDDECPDAGHRLAALR